MSWFTKWLIKSFIILIVICFNFLLNKYLKQHEELLQKYWKWIRILEIAEWVAIAILLYTTFH